MALWFEWHPARAAATARKRRVAFEEAMTAFADPLGGVLDDPAHSIEESRFVLLPRSSRSRLLAVMFTERGPDRVRLISARPATRHERRIYEEGFGQDPRQPRRQGPGQAICPHPRRPGAPDLTPRTGRAA